jgi:hypothetical protein
MSTSASASMSRSAAVAARLSGSAPLCLDDVTEPSRLIARLRDPADPVGAYVSGQFTSAGRAQLGAYDGTEPPPLPLQQAVIAELNRLQSSADGVWSKKALAAARMTSDVRERLKRRPSAADRDWVNRFRLEMAFPTELARTPINQLEQHGARLFTGRYRRVYSAAVERSMAVLESLGAVDDAVRDRLWDPVLFGAHHLAIVAAQKAAVTRRIQLAAAVVVGFIVLATPRIAWSIGGRPPVGWGDLGQVFTYVWGMLAALLVIGFFVAIGSWLSTRLLVRQVHDLRYYAIAFVSWPGLVMGFYAFQTVRSLRLGTVEGVVGAAALMAASGLWLVLLAGLGTHAVASRRLDRWLEDDHPDVIVIHGLLACLGILDADRNCLGALENRQRLADRFETMALCLGRQFGRFDTRDPSDPWVSQTGRELAFAMRKLKRWVATPRLDTAEHLIVRLRSDLVHAAAGAWGHLERAAEEAPPAPSRTRRWRDATVGAVRAIVVAALPFAVVWGAGAFGLGEPLRGQLLVSAGIWAVLTILLYLDPGSTAQLAALRDALPHGKGRTSQP